jgi:hypothetical protein
MIKSDHGKHEALEVMEPPISIVKTDGPFSDEFRKRLLDKLTAEIGRDMAYGASRVSGKEALAGNDDDETDFFKFLKEK